MDHTVGQQACVHTLVTHNGAVHDSYLDDTGDLQLSPPLNRVQVRRYQRANSDRFRFTLGVEVTCPEGP